MFFRLTLAYKNLELNALQYDKINCNYWIENLL